ncbi:MAG: hypothetical protein WD341_10450 [Tistlia sp.]
MVFKDLEAFVDVHAAPPAAEEIKDPDNVTTLEADVHASFCCRLP